MRKKLSQDIRNAIMEAVDPSLFPVEEVIEEETAEAQEEDQEDEEEFVEEGTEEEAEHRCPLCVSVLDDPLDSDTILEHLDVVMSLVDQISELDEGVEVDMDELIDNAFEQLDEEYEEVEDEDEE